MRETSQKRFAGLATLLIASVPILGLGCAGTSHEKPRTTSEMVAPVDGAVGRLAVSDGRDVLLIPRGDLDREKRRFLDELRQALSSEASSEAPMEETTASVPMDRSQLSALEAALEGFETGVQRWRVPDIMEIESGRGLLRIRRWTVNDDVSFDAELVGSAYPTYFTAGPGLNESWDRLVAAGKGASSVIRSEIRTFARSKWDRSPLAFTGDR
ncbi:MAG: hypothetical protein AAGD14_13035 [Planctomycetota bacterium]